MLFDSFRAEHEPGYYDEYEAEMAREMDRGRALGAMISSVALDAVPRDFSCVGSRIESLTDGVPTRLRFLPYTHHLTKARNLSTKVELPNPFLVLSLSTYHELWPLKKPELTHASIFALLGRVTDSASITIDLDFEGGQPSIASSASRGVYLPVESRFGSEKIVVQNVLDLLEESPAP